MIEVRSINPRKSQSASRYIRNLNELLSEIRQIPNVKVIAQDLAKLSFKDQVSLVHSASIYMSMHGAGTTHIMNAALGTKNCCALIELQPDHSQVFHTSQV